jgi:predicted Zn-dependent protease
VLSQPFDMLSPPNYGAWKDVEKISFNPAELKATPVVGNDTAPPQRILSDYGGGYDDPRLHAKLAVILRRLSAASDRPDVDYSITILNSPSVNSYMLPNGQLYVTRGLLALANDSAEVASAMAHQMAHVIARHAATLEEQARKIELISKLNDLKGDPQGA